MGTFVEVIVSVLVLVVLVWCLIFGGIGALVARGHDVSPAGGLALGVALGPFGWLAILWLGRRSRRRMTATEWLTGADSRAVSEPPRPEPRPFVERSRGDLYF
ncbi:MAG TPA: hypothetical protein VF715_01395 [Thermoleophilaceae bacterium]